MPTRDRFLSSLRAALRQLYNSAALQKSPLISGLGLSASVDPASDLRHTLTTAIRSLQPQVDVPADTQAWRVYEILLYRYVQRCTQLEVADQLGMSVRHLRREECKALQALADALKRSCHIDEEHGGGAAAQGRNPPSPIDAELAWLDASSPEEPVDLGQALSAALELVRPLAVQHAAFLDVRPCHEAVALAVHPVALRQVFLSLLGAAIRQAPRQRVSVSIRPMDWQVEVQIQAPKPPRGAGHPGDGADSVASSLEMARHLTEACGGHLSVCSDVRSFVATVMLPSLEQLPVLLIDDNAHTLQLLHRYVSATRYRIFPARNLREALSVAGEVSPQIIVLDVMMPDMDGWELLGHLRQHPLTAHAPIIVCTILAEEELALSLGANGFVRKPVSREAFLGALDRQAYRAEPGSR